MMGREFKVKVILKTGSWKNTQRSETWYRCIFRAGRGQGGSGVGQRDASEVWQTAGLLSQHPEYPDCNLKRGKREA